MISDGECFVYIVPPGQTQFVTAARFRVTVTRDGPVGDFVYGRRYLSRADAVELDPVELKLVNGVLESASRGGFFSAIRDAMPDYWGRRVIERHTAHAQLSEFDYLLQGPDDRAGALGFGRNAEPPAARKAFNRTLNLEKLQTQAEAILGDDPLPMPMQKAEAEQVQELLLEGTSMGGARPKAVVEDDDALWIAKFSSLPDRWNHPRVEHAMLELARSCGLKVADSKVTTVGDKEVLLVRRFDRDKTEAGYQRSRMVSALTLLRSDDDPHSREEWSYLLLADELRRVSSSPEADLRELFARMCFNAFISNTDDHPRNHAALAKDRGWRLSPAFDLTPVPALAEDTRALAMVCGMEGRAARRTNLLSGCGRFLLSPSAAARIFDDMMAAVEREWEPCLERAHVSVRDRATIASAKLYAGLLGAS